MSDNDQLTDEPELRLLRDSLSGVALPKRPRPEAITVMGRTRRRQRLTRVTCLSIAGVATAAGATLGLSGSFSATSTLGAIRTPSYTLVSYTNGTDKLTLNPGELLDPAQLQADLASYGVQAKVTTGSYCTSDPEPAGFSHVVTGPGQGSWQPGSAEQPAMTIDPSAIPVGAELSIGYFRLPTGEQQANVALIDIDSNTCSSTPPALTSETPGFGLLYGGPATAVS